jgi:hypothetical protein
MRLLLLKFQSTLFKKMVIKIRFGKATMDIQPDEINPISITISRSNLTAPEVN